MPAQSSMEGLAKLMAAKAMIGGAAGKVKDFASGDARAEKRMKKRTAKAKAEKAKKILKEEDAAHAEWLRENGSYIQAIKDRMFNSRKILSAEKQGWADGDKRRAQEAADAKEEAKIKRAAWISGKSRGELASQLAHDDNVEREKEMAEKKELHERETQQRHSALALQLKKQAEFADLEKSQIIDMIKRDELAKELNEAKATEIANEKQFLGGMETVSPDDPPGSGDLSGGAGSSGDIVTKLDEQTWEIEEIKNILGKGVLIDEAILKKDTEQANLLIQGLGLHSPPFLETLTKDEGAPSIVPESIGADSAPDVSASPDVSMETMLDGEPMPVQSDQFEELLEIEREELDFDRRREAREIKEARMALEDRRDSKFKNAKGLMGGKGKKPDKKKKKGGLLNTLLKFGGRYLLPMVSGWVGLKTVLGLSTKGDDAARAAKAAKAAAKAAEKAAKQGKKVTKGIDTVTDIAKTGAKTTKLVKVGEGVTDITKTGAKTAKLVKIGDAATDAAELAAKTTKLGKVGEDVASNAVKVAKVGEDVAGNATKIAKVAEGVPSTNLAPVLNKADETTKGLTKASGKVDKVGKLVKEIPKMTTNLVKGLKVLKVGGAATLAKKVIGGADAIPSGGGGATLAKAPPGGDKTSKVIAKGAKVGTEILDKGMKPVTQTVKTVLKVTKGAGKLATTLGKYLAPLDLLNKMGQGQGMWESMGNMVLEIGNLAAGAGEGIVEGVQHLAGGSLGEGGFSDKSASDIAFQDADILGNKEKWQTSYLEQGINKGVEIFTGHKIANKKVYTEEQEELAFAAENDAGAVDIGFGQGEIEDLQALSLLDEKTLEALLAYEVFSDDDQKQIEDLLEAKKMGLKATYDDGGWLGGEKITYGDQEQTEEQKAYAASLDPSKRPDMEEYKPEGEGMFAGMWDKFASLFEHTPDVASADKMAQTTTIMAENATTPGSIFTHDTHLEQTLWNIWAEEKSFFDPKTMGTEATVAEGDSTAPTSQLTPLDNQELMTPVPVIDVSPNAPVMGTGGGMIPSELLAQVISQISAMEKQAVAAPSGGGTMVNTNTNIDNSVRSNNMAASTVFPPAGAMPKGIGEGA